MVYGFRAFRVSVSILAATHCLSFYYHMYGAEMGTLRVNISYEQMGFSLPLWEISGDQQNQWHFGQREIDSAYLNIARDGYRVCLCC